MLPLRFERAHQRSLREHNLEVVLTVSARTRKRGSRRSLEARARGRGAGEFALGLRRPPRNRCNAPERDPRLANPSSATSSATAAEAKAKSYCARSRTFKYEERAAKGSNGSETPTIDAGSERTLNLWAPGNR